ncbi:hypothetical protein FRC02_010871 [Tulasnella sp. 418]|nr:hypothetical protein FRC02_010871 [Tulasnella sp. 418]
MPQRTASDACGLVILVMFYLISVLTFTWIASVPYASEEAITTAGSDAHSYAIVFKNAVQLAAVSLLPRSEPNDHDPKKRGDAGVYSVGNIITLSSIIILLLAFLVWVFKLYSMSRRLDVWINTLKPPKNPSSLPISTPLTPPQGSVFGDWMRSRKSLLAHEEMLRTPPRTPSWVTGGFRSPKPISPVLDRFSETTPLVTKPPSVYVSPHRAKINRSSELPERECRDSRSTVTSPLKSSYIFFHESPSKKERRYALIPWAAPKGTERG